MSIPTRVLPLLLATGLSPALLHAQGCPAPSFLNINQIRTGNGGNPPSGNALIRQPDGSYAAYRGTGRPPSFTFNAILPNYQQSLYACSAIANRAHAPVPGRPNFLDALPGISGRNPLIVDLLGNSTSLSGFGVDYLSNLQNGVSLAVANLDGSLRSSTNYPSGTRPERMVVADFNGDTHRDLAIINAPFNGNGSISVFLGNGTSNLPAAVVYPTGPFPLAITAADFNSDNRPDIAIIDSRPGNNSDRYISVYLNNGNGTFRDPVSTIAPGFGLDLIAADFTGDGRVDLAVGGSPLSVFPGNPDGTFRPPLLSPIPVGPFYIAAGDFNKDGRLDIAASEGPTDAITIHLNTGGGLFTARRSYSRGNPSGSSEPHLLVTDFDGDTWPDIVVGSGHPDAIVANLYSETILRVLINRGDGSGSFFGAPLYPAVNVLATGDFNQDGKVDIISNANIGISFLGGTGAGFQTGVPLAVRTQQGFNQGALAAVAADFNGDSKLDLAVYNGAIGALLGAGNGSFSQPSAYINTASNVSAFAAGDLNGDGKVDLVAALTNTSNPKPTQVLILLGNGDGTFQNPAPFTVCSNPTRLRLANLNADANLDLVATCSGTLFDNADLGGIGVALGNGNGTFQAVSVLPAGANPSHTAVADVTGDNRPELFSSTTVAGQLGGFRIALHLNQGNGAFQAPTFLNTDFGPSALVVTDFSGDGIPDILAGHCCGDTDIGLYVGNGNGTFQNETLTGLGEATNLIPADLNNDSKTDLIAARSSDGIAVLFNLAGTLPVEACTFTLSRTSAVAPSGGDAFGVVVRPSNPNCTWTAASPDSWITVSAEQRTGPGTALVRVAANPTAAFRTGSATIAGLPISINQYPTAAGCTFTLNPTSFSFNGENNSVGITITTGAACQWTSYSSATWLSATNSGTGSNNFASLFAAQNGTGSSRAGVLDVGGARIQVIQRAFNAAQVFNDVALADPFFGHISLMRDRAITSGCTATTYCPSDITNRGQMAVFLIRAILGSENFNFPATPFFTDVPATHPFFRYIQKLRELNVTTGCTATTYCPDDPVTRGQMAAFLVRASLGITPADTFPFPAGAFFTDVPANHPFFSFIQLMRVRGITSGCTANTYCPNDPVTRGQMAVFLVRGLIAQ